VQGSLIQMTLKLAPRIGPCRGALSDASRILLAIIMLCSSLPSTEFLFEFHHSSQAFKSH
jgi:hypothetical protein